ncbi:MAG TPA: hypothetical protein VGK44_04335 [Casimicrobiaceae bacterium]|jgi:hypothetical protein
MLQGDPDWWRLAAIISNEDRLETIPHNAEAQPEFRLYDSLGPVPCVGAIMTAPVVLLLSHPGLDGRSTPQDYSFYRPGWPLSALHPEAPTGIADIWHSRVAALVDRFGAQHVSNSVAAVFLTPWRSFAFADRLRLPSRRRALDLASSVAARDGILLMMRHQNLWTEHPVLAALPSTRRFDPRWWRVTEISERNLGDDAWAALCTRIETHAWI